MSLQRTGFSYFDEEESTSASGFGTGFGSSALTTGGFGASLSTSPSRFGTALAPPGGFGTSPSQSSAITIPGRGRGPSFGRGEMTTGGYSPSKGFGSAHETKEVWSDRFDNTHYDHKTYDERTEFATSPNIQVTKHINHATHQDLVVDQRSGRKTYIDDEIIEENRQGYLLDGSRASSSGWGRTSPSYFDENATTLRQSRAEVDPRTGLETSEQYLSSTGPQGVYRSRKKSTSDNKSFEYSSTEYSYDY